MDLLLVVGNTENKQEDQVCKKSVFWFIFIIIMLYETFIFKRVLIMYFSLCSL